MHYDGSPVQEHDNRTVHLHKLFTYSAVPTGNRLLEPEQKTVKDGIVRFDIPVESAAQDVELQVRLLSLGRGPT